MVWALPVLLLVNTGQTQDIYLRGPRPDYNDDAPRTAAANVYAPEVSVPIPDDDSDVLTPPYWNLAPRASFHASATCGEMKTPDHYCDMWFNECDYCLKDDSNATRRHPIENVIDGSESFWMSPPLSRNTLDNDYSKVNITIDLKQPFHVAYVTIKYALSPRAKTWVLEKSLDGETWHPWQYFAASRDQCLSKFGEVSEIRTTDSTPICTSEYTDFVPATDGEVIVSLINDRPSMNHFSTSEELQEFTRAQYIRIRLLEVNTLYSHLMSSNPDDTTAKKRYFYSIKNIEIGGRCVCNGHAEYCFEKGNEFMCDCKHQTEGRNCEKCMPNFVQNKWKPGQPDNENQCEQCQCFGHSNQCLYNEEVDKKRQSVDRAGNYVGGGVCQDCKDNTEGNNCEKCKAGFWRNPDLEKNESCLPCECNMEHSNGECDPRTGQCSCDKNFGGLKCDSCAPKLFYYPKCDREFHLPPGSNLKFPSECDECSHQLMESILPKTDLIKKGIEDLHNIKAHKLAQTKWESLRNESRPIEHSIQNIKSGLHLIDNMDEAMHEIEEDVCGEHGLAREKDLMVRETNATFHNLMCEAEVFKFNSNTQRTRAETVVGDFEVVEEMSAQAYEARMKVAREQTAHLEQIIVTNPYAPMLVDANIEYDQSVSLLENVKQRFGGSERQGRCHSNRSYKDYSSTRQHPATRDNFEFIPGDISSIDKYGNPIPKSDMMNGDDPFNCKVDNSHIFDDDQGGDLTQMPDPEPVEDDLELNEYEDEDYEEEYYEEPYNEYEPNSYDSERYGPSDTKKDDPNFLVSEEPCEYIIPPRVNGIIPNAHARHELEQTFRDSDADAAFIGLKARVSVPDSSYRWEPQLWRKFKWRGGWADDHVQNGGRCTVMTATGWKSEHCETKLNYYFCLGKDKSGNAKTTKFRYYSIKAPHPVTYNEAVQLCSRDGQLIAVIPSEKTHKIVTNVWKQELDEYKKILQSHYNHQEVPSAAWIGLRANGTASQVAWTWSSGRSLGSETFSKREVEDFNELAVRENKLCVMAKKEYGQINWLAESCDLRRPSICSFNPDPAEFEESLSRSKRSKTHVVIANRAAGEDFLERINREQESDDFDPKRAQFAPLDDLVIKSTDEEYPTTASLADQQECVDLIESIAVETSNKLTDLDSKIAETAQKNRLIDDKLAAMKHDLEEMNSGIDSINAVNDNIREAEELNKQSEILFVDAEDLMDEVDEVDAKDFKIPDIKRRTQEYLDSDLDGAQRETEKARKHALMLKKIRDQLLIDFRIAEDKCWYDDSGAVQCDTSALVGAEAVLKMLAKIKNQIDQAIDYKNDAENSLNNELANLANSFNRCELGTSKRAPDLTSQKNVYSGLIDDLEALLPGDADKLPVFDWDYIDGVYEKVEAMYTEIFDMLYGAGTTDEDITNQNWDGIHGLAGAVKFMSDPGCWKIDEVCDFKTGDSQLAGNENQAWMEKYAELIQGAVDNSTHSMRKPGIANEIGSIERTIQALQLDTEGDEKIFDELEHLTTDIKHLIASSRSLLDRMPLKRNAQQLRQGESEDKSGSWFKAKLPDDPLDFGNMKFAFEMKLNVKLHKPANNIVFFGEARNSLTIDTDEDGHAIALYKSNEELFNLRSDKPIAIGEKWHQIYFTKNGRRLGLSVECVDDSCFSADSAGGGRTDARRRRKKRRRHTKRTTSGTSTFSERIRREISEEPQSSRFLDFAKTAWPINLYHPSTFLFVGDYHSQLGFGTSLYNDLSTTDVGMEYLDDEENENFFGMNGQINGIEINRHMVTPFQFEQKDIESNNENLKVEETLEDKDRCWSPRNNGFTVSRSISGTKNCPCLDGRDSYIMFHSDEIDIEYAGRFTGHLEFTHTSLADRYVIGAIFDESGNHFMLMLKVGNKFKLIIQGVDTDGQEMVYESECDAYLPDHEHLLNLRFGIVKTVINDSKSDRTAGILQWLTNFRPKPEQLPKEHLQNIPYEFWNSFQYKIRNRNFYLGGIPINYLPDKIRAKLVEFKILKEYISTDGQVKDSILSMPVCFERININEDYKNDPKLNLATIDGKGIYQNNEIPVRHDLYFQEGKDYNKPDRQRYKVIQRDFSNYIHQGSSFAEISFGLRINRIETNAQILRFSSRGELSYQYNAADQTGKLFMDIDGEDCQVDWTHEAFDLVVITANEREATLTVVSGSGAKTRSVVCGGLSPDMLSESLQIGGNPFNGVIADIRYQTDNNNYDIINGNVKQHMSQKPDDWFTCNGFECNGIQFNTLYSFN